MRRDKRSDCVLPWHGYPPHSPASARRRFIPFPVRLSMHICVGEGSIVTRSPRRRPANCARLERCVRRGAARREKRASAARESRSRRRRRRQLLGVGGAENSSGSQTALTAEVSRGTVQCDVFPNARMPSLATVKRIYGPDCEGL